MNSIIDNAISGFRSGLNCAQSVISAYADELKIDKEVALSISCGFGAGMGRLQETCGAATGSFMVLGVHICNKYSDIIDRKEKTYALIQNFNKQFVSIHGALDCRTLLNCDLTTEEGHQYMNDNNLRSVVCEKCIADSVKIVNELIH